MILSTLCLRITTLCVVFKTPDIIITALGLLIVPHQLLLHLLEKGFSLFVTNAFLATLQASRERDKDEK